jgi:hypothetical protein
MSAVTAVIVLVLFVLVIVLPVIVLRQRDTLSRERVSHAGEVAQARDESVENPGWLLRMARSLIGRGPQAGSTVQPMICLVEGRHSANVRAMVTATPPGGTGANWFWSNTGDLIGVWPRVGKQSRCIAPGTIL